MKVTQLIGIEPGDYILLYRLEDINLLDLEKVLDNIDEKGIHIYAIPSYNPEKARLIKVETADILKLEDNQ